MLGPKFSIVNLEVSIHLQSTVSRRFRYMVLGCPAVGICVSRRVGLVTGFGSFCVVLVSEALVGAVGAKGGYSGACIQRVDVFLIH